MNNDYKEDIIDIINDEFDDRIKFLEEYMANRTSDDGRFSIDLTTKSRIDELEKMRKRLIMEIE